MNPIQDLHREAMQLAGEAEHFQRAGDQRSARQQWNRAFECERQAAQHSAADLSLEPTRSILHRSAASPALECGKYREAERLIATALAGDPRTRLRKNCAICWKKSTLIVTPKAAAVLSQVSRPSVPTGDRSSAPHWCTERA